MKLLAGFSAIFRQTLDLNFKSKKSVELKNTPNHQIFLCIERLHLVAKKHNKVLKDVFLMMTTTTIYSRNIFCKQKLMITIAKALFDKK
jgi:hypothetical protein